MFGLKSTTSSHSDNPSHTICLVLLPRYGKEGASLRCFNEAALTASFVFMSHKEISNV